MSSAGNAWLASYNFSLLKKQEGIFKLAEITLSLLCAAILAVGRVVKGNITLTDVVLLVTNLMLLLSAACVLTFLLRPNCIGPGLDGLVCAVSCVVCVLVTFSVASDENYRPDCDLERDYKFYHCSSAISNRIKQGDYDVIAAHIGLAWLTGCYLMNVVYCWSKAFAKKQWTVTNQRN